jgi:peptidoglycan/xylan/chitin deacetylase (PgdA/CDA1 family)
MATNQIALARSDISIDWPNPTVGIDGVLRTWPRLRIADRIRDGALPMGVVGLGSSRAPSMKQALRDSLRKFHLAFLRRPLPTRAAIYLHNVSPSAHPSLRETLAYFRDLGYTFVSPAELCAEGSGNRILVSFDDNFAAWRDMLALLDEFGAKAAFYINTLPIRDRATMAELEFYGGRISQPGERTLASAEIREIDRAGHRIGCHTHSHFRPDELDPALYVSEFDDSKRILEDILGHEVSDFAFPYGKRRHCTAALIARCRRLGFTTIANAIPGRQHAQQSPLWINRSPWHLDRPLAFNLENLQIDGRVFERLTGRRVGF